MRDERGFSLLEVLLAVALAAILGMSVPSALSTANKATIISNEHTLGESLARSQMDYVQNQDYDHTNNPPVYTLTPGFPTGYTVVQTAERFDPKGDGTADDDGLQKITVTVMHETKIVYILVDYKVSFER